MDRQEIAMRYLLGALSEEEQTRLEEQYFLDDKKFEQFELAEDELIDRYVRDELSAEDARRFEKLLASPRIAERVEVARLLQQRTVSQPPEPVKVVTTEVKPALVGWWERLFGPAAAVPAFRPVFAMALIFMLLTTVGFILVWSKLQTESNRLAQERQQREALERQIAEQKANYESTLTQTRQEKEEQQQLVERYKQLLAEQQQQPTQALILPLLLNPGGGTRGGGGNAVQSISITHGAKAVAIGLNVTHGDYSSYTAVVRNIDSAKEITRRSNLKPAPQQGRKYITFNVNAASLTPGSYSVHVDGITPDGAPENFDDYTFRISR